VTLSPGVHQIASTDYHQDPCETPSLSASIAKVLVSQSPAHAKAAHPRLTPQPRDDDPRYDVGNAAHRLFLEGEAAVDVFAYTDWRTKESKEARELARSHGRIPMLGGQWDECEAMVDALTMQLQELPIKPALFADGKAEQTLVWEEDGVWCRSRLDWLRDDLTAIDDLKTVSRTADPAIWSKTLYTAGYDVQASFYRRGVQAITGKTPDFRFVVVETTAPYAVSVISLSPEGWALADSKVEYAIHLWRDCLANDRFPGYPTQVCYAEPPGWAESQWLEKELREAA
jgi:hypothetical protein